MMNAKQKKKEQEAIEKEERKRDRERKKIEKEELAQRKKEERLEKQKEREEASRKKQEQITARKAARAAAKGVRGRPTTRAGSGVTAVTAPSTSAGEPSSSIDHTQAQPGSVVASVSRSTPLLLATPTSSSAPTVSLDSEDCECAFCYGSYCEDGSEWIKCACTRWVHEKCVDDVFLDNDGLERFCPFCLN